MCEIQAFVFTSLMENQRTDHEPIATSAFKAKLKKDKILSGNADVQVAISTELSANLLVPAAPGTTAAKVQSRLLSSKPLASDLATIIEDLRFFLQPPELADSVEADDDVISNTGVSEEPRRVKRSNTHDLRELHDFDGDVGNASHPEEGQDDEGWESGTVGEPSSSLDGDTSDSSDENSATNSDSEEEAVSDNDLQVKPAGSHAAVAKTTKSHSAFLPSLSVGYIRGDPDDADWSDSEAKIGDTPLKKNRRGQRARRA
jgi:hypothetical protein